MSGAEFTDLIVATHLDRKVGKDQESSAAFDVREAHWLSIYEIGRLEFYAFLYSHCQDAHDLRNWLVELKGADEVAKANLRFEQYINGSVTGRTATAVPHTLLTAGDLEHWRDHGFLKISAHIPPDYCDAVKAYICEYLHIDLHDRTTWYPAQSDWQGLMLQTYQHPAIAAIRQHPDSSQLFAELYQTYNIVANTEKVSYNPPETASWTFRHDRLHWDIDMSKAADYYIQGLVYLDDVPENRGPLRLVPGFHHQYNAYVKTFETPEAAQVSIQKHPDAIPVPGKKGDVILWQQTLPHAASANHSSLPRFVQYVSFTKL
ncbi:hypothetical protein C7T94_11305 [Pedobacter yulinensis]|uniref:Phytanoyl-CoA dioxygenase n=1 Tax=Pedobacter yulinensis TaxID=2126353 RepID=A0A2T3HL81_9SPHI|nr:phytanoyl-CoA dioxygenase family protein [Pedobacter yulinensis]PST83179.1 hypothetical protein C7T94_11305 [Pedobacter yulinensis]